MHNRAWMYVIGGLVLGLLLGIGWGIFHRQESVAPTTNLENTNTNPATNGQITNQAAINTQAFSTDDLPDRDPAFSLTAQIPVGWVAEYVAGSHAINWYDPHRSGKTSLEQSQIFITYFKASDFQTLSAVDVQSQTATTISGRPAMAYVIQKKSGQPDFVDQPSWRNQAHHVTDIRSTDASPTVFYAFAQAPSVDQATFDQIIRSVHFSSN